MHTYIAISLASVNTNELILTFHMHTFIAITVTLSLIFIHYIFYAYTPYAHTLLQFSLLSLLCWYLNLHSICTHIIAIAKIYKMAMRILCIAFQSLKEITLPSVSIAYLDKSYIYFLGFRALSHPLYRVRMLRTFMCPLYPHLYFQVSFPKEPARLSCQYPL